MSNYTVVGFWPDNHQRFCSSYEADTPAGAEEACIAEHPGVAINAVFLGDLYPVDTDPLIRYSEEQCVDAACVKEECTAEEAGIVHESKDGRCYVYKLSDGHYEVRLNGITAATVIGEFDMPDEDVVALERAKSICDDHVNVLAVIVKYQHPMVRALNDASLLADDSTNIKP